MSDEDQKLYCLDAKGVRTLVRAGVLTGVGLPGSPHPSAETVREAVNRTLVRNQSWLETELVVEPEGGATSQNSQPESGDAGEPVAPLRQPSRWERFWDWFLRRSPAQQLPPENIRARDDTQAIGDWEACQGDDNLDAAFNWMRHVLDRDYSDEEIERAIVVVEVGRSTVYTAHRVDASGVEIRGLLSEAERGHAESMARRNRQGDIQDFANAAAPQMVALLAKAAKRPTDEERAEVVAGLAHKDRDPGQESHG